MNAKQRRRRAMAMVFWRVFNPVARAGAGVAPWWVILETTGRRSGEPRTVPLARGPVEGNTTWVIAVHGRHAGFVRNIEANPRVRLRLRGRWRTGTAFLVPVDESALRRFSRYARMGPATLGIDSMLVKVELDEPS